jgi:uncharacterized protein YndB with AHSA1/START domain
MTWNRTVPCHGGPAYRPRHPQERHDGDRVNDRIDQHAIDKQIELHAPVPRVWRALTDHRQFGDWFQVKLEEPFEVGALARGRITHPGYEHVVWQARIETIEPQSRFAFSWHPYAVDPAVDYSREPPTRVEFTLEPTAAGTRLHLVESGFDGIPSSRRAEALRMNDSGWTQQMENIRRHLESRTGDAPS